MQIFNTKSKRILYKLLFVIILLWIWYAYVYIYIYKCKVLIIWEIEELKN